MPKGRWRGLSRKGRRGFVLFLCPVMVLDLVCEGEGVVMGGLTVFGPAPMRIASPAGAIVIAMSYVLVQELFFIFEEMK